MPGAVSKTKQPTSKLNKSGPENKTKAGDTCSPKGVNLSYVLDFNRFTSDKFIIEIYQNLISE
ncbi:hypothetical protein YC2023_114246 [Brassica napus]